MKSAHTPAGRVLIVESNAAQGALYADLIATHCPRMRVDVCGPADGPLLEDNAGGADVAICSCGTTGPTRLESLRHLLTIRPCLATLVLIPADQPSLADEAIAAGASDVLLRAPGYLQQLPVAVRKNAAISRSTLALRRRSDQATQSLRDAAEHICRLETEIARMSMASLPRVSGRLPMPIITRTRRHAVAA